MNFNNLLYFKTIVEQGQISKAARVLHMSQPPLSQRLKDLEAELGVTLIERSGRNWAVTTEGKALYQRALHVLDLVNTIPEEIHASRHGVEGRATIGCTTLSFSLLAAFIPRLHRLHPGIATRLLIDDSTILEHKLAEHAVDFCVTIAAGAEPGLLVVPLPPTRSALVIPPPLASEGLATAARTGGCADIAELHEKPLILFRRFDGTGTYTRTMEIFREHDIAPRIVLDSPDSRVLLNMLEQGLEAIALVPESEIPAGMRERFPVCALPDCFPRISPCLARVKDRYLPRAARTAWTALLEFVGLADPDGI